MAKPNRWVDFIRKWAKDNDTSYSCALSNPKCKDAYRAKYGIRKAVPARTERERMGLEDVDAKPKPKKMSFRDKVDAMVEETRPAREAAKAAKDAKKKKKLRIVEDEFIRPESVKGAMVVAEPPKKKHTRRPPYEPYKDAEGLGLWDSLMKASQEGMERRGGGSYYRL